MTLKIVRDDLVNMRADAVVLPSNEKLDITGGAGGAVALKAGRWLLQRACRRIGGCAVGEAVSTRAYSFPAKRLIHAVGPVWRGGAEDERLLRSAYDNALGLAAKHRCRSVALPLLSAGSFGCPAHVSLEIALDAIGAFLEEHDVEVTLVLFDKQAVRAGLDFLGDLEERIDNLTAERARYGTDAYYAAAPSFDGDRRETRFSGYGQLAPGSYGRRVDEPEGEGFTWGYGRESEASTWGYEVEGEAPAWEDGTSEALYSPGRTESFEPVRPADEPDLLAEEWTGYAPSAAERTETLPSMPAPSKPWSDTVWHKETPRFDYQMPGAGTPSASAPPPPAAGAPAYGAPRQETARPQAARAVGEGLEERLGNMEEGFSRTLMQLIDESGFTDAEVYRRANMSRQHFSKIRSNVGYRPTKATVLSLCVALRLDLEKTRTLLARAGFALSHSSKFDIIVEYFIERGEYDQFKINETLFYFDQPLLGG